MTRSQASKSEKGFTLIELIVVIAIIAVLASVVLAALGASRQKAEVVQVKQNYQSVVKSLELYHQKYGVYPLEGVIDQDESGPDTDDIGSVDYIIQNYLQEYITSVPTLPASVGSSAYLKINSVDNGIYSCGDTSGTEPYVMYFTPASEEDEFLPLYSLNGGTPTLLTTMKCLSQTAK